MPNVPSVALVWPSADVVAQQSVSVMVLKPARMCVAAMALWDSRTLLVGRAHRGLDAAVREEAAEHDRLRSVLQAASRLSESLSLSLSLDSRSLKTVLQNKKCTNGES